MIDLTLLAEGKCELQFAKSPLAHHLGLSHVFVHPVAVLTSKDNRRSIQFRGGVISYHQVKADLLRFIKRDVQKPRAWITTMIDLYRLPTDFPGADKAKSIRNPHERVVYLESEMSSDINYARLIPYIQLHEFEAMLFADPTRLSEYYSEGSYQRAIQSLVDIRTGFANAELINDGEQTAPSKRIIAAIPQYESEKATAGPQLLSKIGLPAIRIQCPHFNDWLTRLERLDDLT